MASPAARSVVRVVAVVLLVGGGAIAAFLVASDSDEDGARAAPPTPPTASSPVSATPQTTPSASNPPGPALEKQCRSVARRLAEIDFAIRGTWKARHERARELDKPKEKGAVYRDAARYFSVLRVRLRALRPPDRLVQIRDLLLRALETSIEAANKLAAAFATNDDDVYEEGVDKLNESSAFHDAADRQLRALDCSRP